MEDSKEYANYFKSSKKLEDRGIVFESFKEGRAVFSVKKDAEKRLIQIPVQASSYDEGVAESVVASVSGSYDRTFLVEN